jgi:uncharacterized protein (TIGR02246 family)
VTEDEVQIHRVVKQLEVAWNRGDSCAFVVPFADDADFIDVQGEHHRGHAQIEAGHRQIFDTVYRGSQAAYAVERIRIVRSDVVIVFVRARLLSRLAVAADGHGRSSCVDCTVHEDYARPTLIMAKNHGKWQIIAFQNTRVAEMQMAGSELTSRIA